MQSQAVKQQPICFGKFSIFLLIKTSHNNYGIKNADYQRYRKYCSNKIQKLRKSMGIKYGNKTKFIKKDIMKEKSNDIKTLQVALYNCQKYWAEANQTKYSVTRKQSQKSRARFFAIRKLKKAIQWCSKLCSACNDKTDYSTKLEANAYMFYLQGMLSFQSQDWNQAQVKLIASRQIMDELIKSCDSLSENIFRQKIDQLDQTIKFCNFKISKGKDMPISEIIQMKKLGDANLSSIIQNLTQQRLTQISLQQSHNNQIHFGQQRYPVKQQKILLQKSKIDLQLKNLQEIKIKSLSNLHDQELYEELLMLYSNVVVLIQDGIKLTDDQRESGKKTDKYTQGELEILKKITVLFQQLKTTLFIDRNYTIFKQSYNTNKGRKSTPQTIAKLLTATINNLNQLSEIVKQKGTISGSSSLQEIQSIDEKAFYLRTLRLIFVGQVYFNNDKIKEAYGLWNQCSRAMNILSSKQEMKNQKQLQLQKKDPLRCDLVTLQKMSQQLKQSKLKCIIQNHKLNSRDRVQLTKMMAQTSITPSQTLNITLQSLLSSKQQSQISLQKLSQIEIIQLPGNIQPIPTRPIFFDIYQTEITYPTLEGKIKQSTGGWGWFKKVFK